MITDAVHSGADVLATVTVFVGLRIAGAPPDERHHYGHARAESVAAKIVALLLIMTGVGAGWSALGVIRSGQAEMPEPLALWAALFSILAKEGLYRYTLAAGRKINSPALIADAHNHRTDAISSLAAVAGVAGARLGWPILDPVAAVAVSALVLRMGIKIYWKSIEELIDTAPEPKVVQEITSAAHVPGVISVNDIRARLHGPHVRVDLKICVNPSISVREGHDIAHRTADSVQGRVDTVNSVLVHVNPCHRLASGVGGPDCARCERRRQPSSVTFGSD